MSIHHASSNQSLGKWQLPNQRVVHLFYDTGRNAFEAKCENDTSIKLSKSVIKLFKEYASTDRSKITEEISVSIVPKKKGFGEKIVPTSFNEIQDLLRMPNLLTSSEALDIVQQKLSIRHSIDTAETADPILSRWFQNFESEFTSLNQDLSQLINALFIQVDISESNLDLLLIKMTQNHAKRTKHKESVKSRKSILESALEKLRLNLNQKIQELVKSVGTLFAKPPAEKDLFRKAAFLVSSIAHYQKDCNNFEIILPIVVEQIKRSEDLDLNDEAIRKQVFAQKRKLATETANKGLIEHEKHIAEFAEEKINNYNSMAALAEKNQTLLSDLDNKQQLLKQFQFKVEEAKIENETTASIIRFIVKGLDSISIELMRELTDINLSSVLAKQQLEDFLEKLKSIVH